VRGTQSGTSPAAQPGSFTGGTVAATAPGRPGAKISTQNEPTVVTSPAAATGQATIDRSFANQPTVVDRVQDSTEQARSLRQGLSGAATTMNDAQPWPAPQGSPAVTSVALPLEPKKNRAPLIAGVVALVVLAIVAAAFFIMKKQKTTDVATTGTATQTSVTTTATPVSSSDGVLLLTSPFGETARIVNMGTNKEVLLSDNVVPLRKSLPPGNYRIILTSARGEETREVKLAAGQVQEIKPTSRPVDVDRAAEEILHQ
jgi:hypothetical protein